MRILHIITRLILGGAQENTILTCEGQHADGHEVTLAFGPIYGPEGSLHDRARTGGYDLVELRSMVRAVHPWKDWRAHRQCRALIERVKPDVVHTHSSKAGILGRAAAWSAGVPAVIHTIHGLPFHPYQSALKNRLYIALERYAARRCHHIVTVADAMTEQALAAGIGSPKQFTTVHSGMEIEPFVHEKSDPIQTRAELGLTRDDIVVGTVARLAELKGHDDLIDILPGLVEAIPNLRLLWVGDGWWRDRLTDRVRALGLDDHVVTTGLVPPEQVPRYLRAMDLLVHPSYREGLPRTLPQALLAGVPVVSYDGDGAGEICIDHQTGRLVPQGDTAQLAGAIREMLEHPVQRTEMARRGRDLARERFAAATMVERLNTVYAKVLNRTEAR